ncbi:MAG: hypothetical protein GY715_20960 [Planctomycetes bacterium]|nr:hypothetical protein [Planctomycetota bacterium]
MIRERITTGLTIAILGTGAVAQWSTDPAVNLAIGDAPVQDTQPKVAPTSDGGCYISWFSGSGFDVRLQRLDASGVEQWAHNGILIADRGFSSTQDYDLDVDGSDNAVLAFRDDRFSGTKVTAQMVTPTGTTPWGANGVQFDDGVAFVAAPKIAAATDGSIFVGWSHESETRIQRLDAAGTVLWLTPTALPNPEPTQVMSDMNASDNGTVIVSSVSYVSFPSAKHLYAQKVDASGSAVWPDWTTVMGNNSLQFGNFPTFVPDGSGGAVFAWYTTGGALQSWVQHVLANGTVTLPANGLAVSTGVGERTGPSVSYNPITDEIFVFWSEELAFQYGIYGQKIDAEGTRAWGNSGVVISPLSDNVVGGLNSIAGGCGATVFYGEELSFDNDRIRASQLDGDGNAVWVPSILTPGAAATGKSRLVAAPGPEGGAVLAWVDSSSGSGDLYAQRTNRDGTLGMPPVTGDATGDGIVNFADILAVIGAWGTCCGCAADLNNDGVASFADILLVIGNWS